MFRPCLRGLVLVFFNDILVYSTSWEEHLSHLRVTLTVLKENQFVIKPSKCFFGVLEVEYLGDYISHQGVHVNPRKIEAVIDWPVPNNVTELRGFWDLPVTIASSVLSLVRLLAHYTILPKRTSFNGRIKLKVHLRT